MFKSISKLAMTVAAASVLATGAVAPRPAAAQSSGTLNTLLGAAAVIGGLVLYNNYQHKRQAANTVVGYTQNGGTIFGDGRIVMPSGQTIYPNANGQYPWGQAAYYNPSAATSGYRYDYNRSGQYMNRHAQGNGNGHAYGRYKDKEKDHDRKGDGDNH